VYRDDLHQQVYRPDVVHVCCVLSILRLEVRCTTATATATVGVAWRVHDLVGVFHGPLVE
jgi:hypothetical protein